jgi:hypothetical protein
MINLNVINNVLKGSVLEIKTLTKEELSFYDTDFTKGVKNEKVTTFKNNQPITEQQNLSEGKQCCTIESFYYNQTGAIERISKSVDGEEERLETFKYDESGQLIERDYSSEYTNSTLSYKYTNTEVFVYSKRTNGSMERVRIYQLDEMKRVIKESILSYDGIKLIREYSYETKNEIEYITQTEGGIQLYFENGLIMAEMREGITYKSYEYSFDQFDNWITKIEKDHGFVITKIETREIIYN